MAPTQATVIRGSPLVDWNSWSWGRSTRSNIACAQWGVIGVVAQRLGAGPCRFRDEDHDHASVLSECGVLVYRHGHPSHVLTFQFSSCPMLCTKTNVP